MPLQSILMSAISICIFSLILYFICSKLKFDHWLDKSNARRITAIFLTFIVFVILFGGINESHITGIFHAIGEGFAFSQFIIVISFVAPKKSRMTK